MNTALPPIVVTLGEPAGIGPDLVLQFTKESFPFPWVVIADPKLLQARSAQLGLTLDKNFPVLPLNLPNPTVSGVPDVANAEAVLAALRRATKGCLSGEFSALVTGPIHKATINAGGTSFQGHTEFLAELTQTKKVVMMLQTEGLRVALATTHLPLKDVARALNAEDLTRTLRVLRFELKKYFGIPEPHILICGLNPHAGEGGYLGTEEIDIIIPVVQQLKAEGFDLQGPLPADTLFTPKYLATADAVLAMYHDQGLPVLKHMGFGRAVNITLGLPIVRTSVDHGTAFDLVGTGKADAGSLKAALMAAYHMAKTNYEITSAA